MVDRTLDMRVAPSRRGSKSRARLPRYAVGFGGGGGGGSGYGMPNPFAKTSGAHLTERGGLVDRLKGHLVERVEVDILKLSSAVNDLVSKFEAGLAEDDVTKPYHIDGVDLSLAVNGSGGIELIGKVSMEVQTGITVHIKRKEADKAKHDA